MVAKAQSAERRVVVPEAAGSTPVSHPQPRARAFERAAEREARNSDGEFAPRAESMVFACDVRSGGTQLNAREL